MERRKARQASPDYLSPSPDRMRKDLIAAMNDDKKYRQKESRKEYSRYDSFDEEEKKRPKTRLSPDRSSYHSPADEYRGAKKPMKKKRVKDYDEDKGGSEPWSRWKGDLQQPDRYTEIADAEKREDERDFDAREQPRHQQPAHKRQRRSSRDQSEALEKDGYKSVEDKDGKTTFYHYAPEYKTGPKDRSTSGRSKSPKPKPKAERKRKLSEGSPEPRPGLVDYSDLETDVKDHNEDNKDKVMKKKKKVKTKKPTATSSKSNLLGIVTEILKQCNEPLKDLPPLGAAAVAPTHKEEPLKPWAPDTKYHINVELGADSSVVEVKSLEDGEIHGSDSEDNAEKNDNAVIKKEDKNTIVDENKPDVQRKVILFLYYLFYDTEAKSDFSIFFIIFKWIQWRQVNHF